MPAYIKYRQGVVSKPTSSSVKNTPLSSTEIDGNLHSLEDAISNIESDSWITTNRIGESQVTPSKLSTDSVGFKNKIGVQTATTGSTIIAKGTTADRDSNPVEGYFRYNITLGKPEWRNATTWISATGNSDVVYIGTTPIALNRANSTLSLTGVSIDGNSGTVTNGVYTNGDQVIGGNKTFSNNLTISASNINIGNGSDGEKQLYLHNSARITYFYVSATGVVGLWDVTGNINRWYTDVSGNFTSFGNITAYSDVRLKEDIVPISNALDKVSQLTGYTYKRIDTNVRQTGLIAQELQKVLPEAVLDGEVLSISYGNLAGLFVQAINELQKKIKFLEDKISNQS